jgi:hypothetical protein
VKSAVKETGTFFQRVRRLDKNPNAGELLRVAGLRELKAASGKVDYVGAGEKMEALELREDQLA